MSVPRKMAKDELSAYPASSHSTAEPKLNSFLCLHHHRYLAVKGMWLDLAYGISGV
jgi:hypothetical protein